MHFAIEAVYQVTGHPPLPYINTSHLEKIATRGGVDGQLPRNFNWSHFYYEEGVVTFKFYLEGCKTRWWNGFQSPEFV